MLAVGEITRVVSLIENSALADVTKCLYFLNSPFTSCSACDTFHCYEIRVMFL